MLYIIDANNLAGKMKLLGEKVFDKKLIAIIRRFNRGKGRQVVLVFDGVDPYGDKQEAGDNVTVVYSPKDKYYKSADDKIVEIVRKKIMPDTFIVTDDRELSRRVEKVSEESRNKIAIINASVFAVKLNQKNMVEDEADAVDNYRGLDEDKIKNINRELLDLWK